MVSAGERARARYDKIVSTSIPAKGRLRDVWLGHITEALTEHAAAAVAREREAEATRQELDAENWKESEEMLRHGRNSSRYCAGAAYQASCSARRIRARGGAQALSAQEGEVGGEGAK